MDELYMLTNWKTRSICPENFTGEKGKGGMAETGTGADPARELGKGWKISPSIHMEPGTLEVLADIEGPGMIQHIWITESSNMNRQVILRIYWDDSEKPSVETPLGDFFACADHSKPAFVNSAMVCVNPRRAFNCYWHMPFRKRCKITLENIGKEMLRVYYQVDYQLGQLPENCAYFHAKFNRVNPLPYKEVYTILGGVQGKGQYVGTYLFWGVNSNGWWGEGEIKFYMDGDQEYPTICGTGTEDYFCGSWNFDIGGAYKPYCTQYAGLANISQTDDVYKANRRFSMYRWHVRDPIYFENDLRVTIQALGWRSERRYLPLQDDISSVAYFYLDKPYDVSGSLPDRDGLEII